MKALVTGGLGFVGSNLVDQLVESGYRVTVIDDLSSESASTDYMNPKAIYHCLEVEKIWQVLAEETFDVVFHLAAHGRIQPSFKEPEEWFENNAMATVKMLEYARKTGVGSFVYATTSSKSHGTRITPYTFSKVVGEEACRMYAEIYGMNVGIATFYNVYGPREPREGEWATVVAKFLRQNSQGQPLTVVGNGEQSRDFTHVEDICRGLIAISQKRWKGDNFDLGRGEPIRIIDLAQAIVSGDESRIQNVPLRKNEGLHTIADWKKTHVSLGWRAKHRLLDYIREEVKPSRRRDLGLINYEGDVLKMNREDEKYPIYDQWDSLIEVLDLEGLCLFLEGKTDLVDSEGRAWNWLKEHVDARTPLCKIFHYIKS